MNWIALIAIVVSVVVCLTIGFFIFHKKMVLEAVAKAAEQARSEGFEKGLGIVLVPHSMHDLPSPAMYVYLKGVLLPEVDANLWIMRRIGEQSEDRLMTRLIYEEFPGKAGEGFMIDKEGTFRQPPHHKIERPARNRSTSFRREPPPLRVTAPPSAQPAGAAEAVAPAATNGSGAAPATPQPRERYADKVRRERREFEESQQAPTASSTG